MRRPAGSAWRHALGRIVGIDPSRTLAAGAKVRVSIRPEDLSTQAPQDADAVPVNAFDGT